MKDVEFETHLPEDEALARALGALATPSRIALLRELREPKALREIRVRGGGSGDEARTISRQAVKEHLERLIEIGVVLARDAHRDYGATTEYSLNHQTLYALAEEFRALARLRPTAEPDAHTVRGVAPHPASAIERGSVLVLVKGLDEGRTFDLSPPATGTRQWVVGRRRGLEVALDFDPFVSTENAVVTWQNGAHHVEDLPDSRNGTQVNFQDLPKGQKRALRTGDVIGVGRSLLLYRA